MLKLRRRSWWSAIAVALAAMLFAVAVRIGHPNNFPTVDHSRLLITLERSACFGDCPDYRVRIDGYGRVEFSTETAALGAVEELHRAMSSTPGVLHPGTHVDRIDRRSVDALVERFRKARFFSLRDSYVWEVTDLPTQVLTLETGHGRKRVLDYGGDQVGMPRSVAELQVAVDRAAGSARWVRGATGLVAYLEKTGFDFRSERAAGMLLQGVAEADESTLVGLIDRGAPLDEPLSAAESTRPVGAEAIIGSIRFGRARLFKALVDRGWLGRVDGAEANQVLAEGAAGCNPEFVDVAVDAGLLVDAVTPRPADYHPEDGIPFGETALAGLAGAYGCRGEGPRTDTAKRLLARGANPNSRDSAGETPIFGVESAALLRVLLASGADPRARDSAGRSAVFSTWNDEIIAMLLEAGASPAGRDSEGKTLAQLAAEKRLLKTARWLKAHPVQPN